MAENNQKVSESDRIADKHRMWRRLKHGTN